MESLSADAPGFKKPRAIMKLIVYVPDEHEERVRLALGEAGAGKVGNYDFCSFVVKGTGHFRPLAGTNPYKGEEGRIEEVEECRIETVCYEKDLPKVLKAMREAHPYEEVAYDVLPLLNNTYTDFVGIKNKMRTDGKREKERERKKIGKKRKESS